MYSGRDDRVWPQSMGRHAPYRWILRHARHGIGTGGQVLILDDGSLKDVRSALANITDPTRAENGIAGITLFAILWLAFWPRMRRDLKGACPAPSKGSRHSVNRHRDSPAQFHNPTSFSVEATRQRLARLEY